MPRRLIITLVLGLPVVGVAFIVVMGGYLLASATGDEGVATVLAWVGGGLILMLATNALLLLGFLGVMLIAEVERDDGSENQDT